MRPDARQSRASFASQYNGMVGLVAFLPALAIFGAAVAIWYIDKLSFPLSLSYEIFFIADVAAAVLVGLITLLVWSRVRENVRQSVLQLAAVAQAAAEGAPGVRANVAGNDEFTQLALNFNALIEQRAATSPVGLDATALQGQIEKLLQEVSAVGEGDLRVQAEVTPDTLGVLADSFNYMIEELAKVVGRVQNTSQQVIMATRRILERASELSRASETQFAQTTQTLEQVEDLAAFILSAARNATLSASAAQDALRSSQEGQEAVNLTIQGMQIIRDNVQDTAKKIKRLGERSQEISDIVRVIEELAEQTNLLALNAAIQSAMAGENGQRGNFAVVADEIRLLAERSGEAAKRIVTLVKGIQTETQEVVQAMEDSTGEVVKGSNMADNAGRALQAIYFAVENQVRMVEDIATAASDRSSTSELVAAAMNRIADLTRQTNTMMQDTATNVTFLAGLADQLRASVSTFRLPPTQPQQLPPQGMGRPMGPPPDPRQGGYYPQQQPGPMQGGPMGGQGQPLPALPPGGYPTGTMGGMPQQGPLSPTNRPFNGSQTGAFPTQGPGHAPSRPNTDGNGYGQNPNQPPPAPFDPWSTGQDGFDEEGGRPPLPPYTGR